MLSETLQDLVERQIVTCKELAMCAAVGKSTVYRWVSGESEPGFTHVSLLVRSLPVEAGLAIQRKIAEGTDYYTDHPDDAPNADINGDGTVNLDDVLDGSVRCCDEAQRMLVTVRETTRDGEIDNKDLTSISAVGASMERSGRELLRAAQEVSVSRQQAKPLRVTG